MAIAMIVLCLLTLLPGNTTLTGTWALDRVRSDFGAAAAPKEFVICLEQLPGSRLDITVITGDSNGQRVTYLEGLAPVDATSVLLRINADEEWRLTAADELTITRVIHIQSQSIRQKLVLARCTRLE